MNAGLMHLAATANSAGPAPDVNSLHPIAGHSSALLLLGRSDPKGQDPKDQDLQRIYVYLGPHAKCLQYKHLA